MEADPVAAPEHDAGGSQIDLDVVRITRSHGDGSLEGVPEPGSEDPVAHVGGAPVREHVYQLGGPVRIEGRCDHPQGHGDVTGHFQIAPERAGRVDKHIGAGSLRCLLPDAGEKDPGQTMKMGTAQGGNRVRRVIDVTVGV